MKILVLGASGRTGRQIIEQALENNHEVIAFIRNTKKLDIKHKKLSIIEGDVRKIRDVEKAIKKATVIISAIGGKLGRKPVCEEGISNIIYQMKKYGKKRIIAVSTFGTGKTKRRGFYAWLLWTIITKLMRDKEKMEERLQKSGLNWTILMPTKLTNSKKTEEYKSGENLMPKGIPKISRADVAHFALKIIKSKKTIHRKIVLTY